MSITRNCIVCNKEFKTKQYHISRGQGKFCSRACHAEWQRHNTFGEKNNHYTGFVTLICKHCGKEFKVKLKDAKRGRKYCGHECAYASKDRVKHCTGENNRFYKGGKVKHNCVICGKEHLCDPCRIRPTCGNSECISKQISLKALGENNPNWTGENIKIPCVVCGKIAERRPWQAKKLKNINNFMCSSECRKKSKLETRSCLYCNKEFQCEKKSSKKFCSQSCAGKIKTGEKNSNWNGGTSFEPYCTKFTPEFKERVRAFWGYKCANCGALESDDPKGWRLAVPVSYTHLTLPTNREV